MSRGPLNTARESIPLTLRAGEQGELASIQIADQKALLTGPGAIERLNMQTRTWVNNARLAGQEVPEIALQIDDRLRYEAVKQALNAITEYRDANGAAIPLVTHVRFADAPKTTPSPFPQVRLPPQ
jgi:hypothetical protein